MFGSFGREYWSKLRENDRNKYSKEKQKTADRLIEILDKKTGNIKKRVELIDVATPATLKKYTNNEIFSESI